MKNLFVLSIAMTVVLLGANNLAAGVCDKMSEFIAKKIDPNMSYEVEDASPSLGGDHDGKGFVFVLTIPGPGKGAPTLVYITYGAPDLDDEAEARMFASQHKVMVNTNPKSFLELNGRCVLQSKAVE
ncbi:MAG TPA: hypothetical protein VEL47_03785 [Myxococcota bacterium]|nr:hypothetical protein [Myxococcota bacterium]